MFGRKFLFIVLLLIFGYPTWAQDSKNHWSLDASYGLEAHDKRLFEWPHPDIYLNLSPEYFGTFKYRLGLAYRLEKEEKWWSNTFGIGASLNLFTMDRPIFRIAFQDPPIPLDITSTNKYKIYTSDFLYKSQLNFKKISIHSLLQTEFSIVKTAFLAPSNRSKLGPRFDPQLYAFSWFGGVGYRFDHFSFSLLTRILYFRQYDPAIFAGLFKAKIGIYPLYYYHWGEWYNPVNFTLYFSYPINPEKIKKDQTIHQQRYVQDSSYQFLQHVRITLGSSIEAHDKRLFDVVDKEAYLSRSPEYFGTYHLRFGFEYLIGKFRKINHYAGINYHLNKSTLYRLISWYGWDNPPPINLPLLADAYSTQSIEFNYHLEWNIYRKWILNSKWGTDVLFSRNAREYESGHLFYQKWDPELFSFNWNVGVGYRFSRFILEMNYRILYHRKYDLPILSELFDYKHRRDLPLLEHWGDWYNPVHLSLDLQFPIVK